MEYNGINLHFQLNNNEIPVLLNRKDCFSNINTDRCVVYMVMNKYFFNIYQALLNFKHSKIKAGQPMGKMVFQFDSGWDYTFFKSETHMNTTAPVASKPNSTFLSTTVTSIDNGRNFGSF